MFKGFDYFVHSFLFIAVWGIGIVITSAILGVLPVIGKLAAPFSAYSIHAFLMFGIFLIVDKEMPFWPFFGLSVIAGLIGSAGAIASGIGVIFTIPIQGCILAVAYRDVFGR